jgi:arginase
VDVALVQVPYHLGHERVGMGAGPERLVEAGAVETLERAGHGVEIMGVRRRNGETNEVGASFEVVRRVAEAVRDAVVRGAFPLVMAGNCTSSIGIVAGLDQPNVGVVWLDAHPDFNTAEESLSGFADGMGLSILTGTGWDALRATVPGYRPVPEERVVLVGIRDIDPSEQARLDRGGVTVVEPGAAKAGGIAPALEQLRERTGDVYLHLDLDVLDPSEGRANEYAAPGGLSAAETSAAITAIGERFRLRAAAVTAYDPALDPDGAFAETAIRLLCALVEARAVHAAVAAP